MLNSQLVIVLISLVLVESNGHTESVAFTESSNVVHPEPWISDLFYQALANFTVRDVGSTACRIQGDMYDKHLRNYTNWAVRMAESWIRHPIGILGGNRYHFGIYDECIGVHYPIKGQYCLSEVKLISKPENNYSSNRGENLHKVYNSDARKTILEWINSPVQIQRNILNLGICIPNSCTASDLQTSLQKNLDLVFVPENINAIVKVDQIMCTVSEDTYPYNTAFFITSAFFGLLVTMCCGTTVYHYARLRNPSKIKGHENSEPVFYSFSIIKSLIQLLKYDKNNELNVLNGNKVLTMVFILFGHRFLYLAGNPFVNGEVLENIYSNGPNILLTSMNLVDPFLYTSGFIMYLTLSSVFKKSGPIWIKIILPIVYRIIRMLPAYCAMMAITAHIVPHLGDGPLWPKNIWHEAEKCKNYWWTNMLFISNFIDSKYQCLILSWYISCDIQFFIIGVLIVYVYMKNIKYGIGLLITTLGISLSVPFIVTILTKNDGIVKLNIPFLENPRNSTTFNELYRPSYMRVAPFLIGLIASLVIEKLKESKFKFSLVTVYGGTFVITVISLWIQLSGAKLYTRPYNPLEHALYSVLSHCTWPMLGLWLSICHHTTGYGLITKVLTNKVVVVMGRLSYSVFLVNLIVMMVSQSSQRTSYHISIKSSVDAWICDSFKSYLMGLMLYLIVEAPFGNLTRLLFGRGTQKKSSQNGISNENTKYTKTEESNSELNNITIKAS